MARYDFKCNRCNEIQEFIVGMNQIEGFSPLCRSCIDKVDPAYLHLYSDEELEKFGAVKMSRHYSTNGLHNAFVNKSLGSWMDKNKNSISRPKEWFSDHTEKLRKQTEERERQDRKYA